MLKAPDKSPLLRNGAYACMHRSRCGLTIVLDGGLCIRFHKCQCRHQTEELLAFQRPSSIFQPTLILLVLFLPASWSIGTCRLKCQVSPFYVCNVCLLNVFRIHHFVSGVMNSLLLNDCNKHCLFAFSGQF